MASLTLFGSYVWVWPLAVTVLPSVRFWPPAAETPLNVPAARYRLEISIVTTSDHRKYLLRIIILLSKVWDV
ncbi:hypothetical protein D3C73_1365710 [compost metagenome]